MRIPDDVRARMRSAGDGKAAAEEGTRIAAEALASVKSRVQGVYFMPPFGRVEMALDVLSRI
jgi:homocysteine S-methyltransferase